MKSWPHAPSKVVNHPGAYFVTGATYQKRRLLDTRAKLDFFYEFFLETCLEKEWSLQAWAVFPNHYHFVGFSPDIERPVEALTRKLHGKSAIDLNKIDSTPGRTVWYRSWDTRLTYEKSYLTRLSSVHWNPVKHGIVRDPLLYRWCSARWFAENTDRSFYETVIGMPHDKLRIGDDF